MILSRIIILEQTPLLICEAIFPADFLLRHFPHPHEPILMAVKTNGKAFNILCFRSLYNTHDLLSWVWVFFFFLNLIFIISCLFLLHNSLIEKKTLILFSVLHLIFIIFSGSRQVAVILWLHGYPQAIETRQRVWDIYFLKDTKLPVYGMFFCFVLFCL